MGCQKLRLVYVYKEDEQKIYCLFSTDRKAPDASAVLSDTGLHLQPDKRRSEKGKDSEAVENT